MQITIGIPSYNEQLSIANLLKALENQVVDGHRISEVIVCDDSTDDTPDVVNEFAKNSRMNITLIHHNKRRGAASAWNEIFNNTTGEIVVLYDADIIPDKRTTVLLASGIKGAVALCAGNPMSLRQKGVAAKASTFAASWLRRVRNSGLSQYTVMGRALSIRTEIARKITVPDIIAIDLYLQCKVLELGYNVDYSDDAVVWFKPANTMLDFTSQVTRALRGHEEIKDYVNKLQIGLPSFKFVKEGMKEAFSDPLGMFSFALSCATFPIYRIRVGDKIQQTTWHVADSTKGISAENLPSSD